jgi:hypothetical protein
MAVTFSQRNWATAGFLLFWLTGWTVGCVAIAAGAFSGKYFLFLFGIPFWASWVFVAGLVSSMLFKVERLELDREGVRYTCRVIVQIKERRVPLREVVGFVPGFKPPGYKQPLPIFRLNVKSTGTELQCFNGMTQDEVTWLSARLNGLLTELSGRVPEVVEAEAEEEVRSEFEAVVAKMGEGESIEKAEEIVKAEEAAGREILLPDKVLALPSDSLWTREVALGDICFAVKGKTSWSAVGGLLFINLFWNGIVSVFVFVLWGGMHDSPVMFSGEWWLMFLFLIPFEVIGVGMFLGLLAAIFAPFMQVRWVFTYDQVVRSRHVLGMGRTKVWGAKKLDRLEIGRVREKLGVAVSHQQDQEVLSTRALVLIDRDNAEVCRIDGLTDGEARHIGQTLLAERIKWFS